MYKKISLSLVGILALVGFFAGGNLASAQAVQSCNGETINYTLYGTVTPNGSPTEAWFDWGPTASLQYTTPHQTFSSNSSYTQIIGNLASNTTYYYRAMAQNQYGTATGQTKSFQTTTCAPINVTPTVTLTANPTSVQYNGSSTLSWTSTNAALCSGTWGTNGWAGTKTLSGNFNTGALTNSTTFGITCQSSSGQEAQSSVTVNVTQIQNPTVTLTANPSSIQAGQNSTLSWNSQYTTSCSAYWTNSSATSGSGIVVPTSTTNYSITCYGTNGQQVNAQATVNVTQIQTPTVTLTANPSSIQSGQNSTLSWNSTNVTSCSSAWGGNGLSGNQTVYPTSTTNYSITCYGTNGQQVSVSATVNVTQVQTPTVTLTANPASIQSGQNSTLSWSSQNATSCSAYWTNSSATSGSGIVVPTSTTNYSITCYGQNGQQVSVQTTVNVTQIQTPTVTLSANPQSVSYNGASTVSWTSTNAISCSATNGTNGWAGNKSTSGSFYTGALTNSTTFSINCTSSTGQQAYASTTVSVGTIQTCQDTSANNYGGALPCTYTQVQVCQDPSALNYRGVVPCSYPQPQICQDPIALNYRGVLPCAYNIVNNQQPTVVIYADSTNLPFNGATTIRWNTANATSCNASGGSVGWAGVKSIGPGSFYTGSLTASRTYAITCSNNFGSSNDAITITVRGQVLGATTVKLAPTSLVLITSSVDRNQPIVPTIDNTRPHPGDEINYTVNYQNIGTGAITNLNLQMNLPQEVDYIFSKPSNPNISGNTLTFSLGTLKANGQGTVTVRVRVRDNIPDGTSLNFPATLSYIDPSGFPQSVSANVSAQVLNQQPVIAETVTPAPVIPLGANVFAAGTFLPGNLFGWLLLLLLLLIIALLISRLVSTSKYKKIEVVE